jgi:hypothetical protein
MSSTCETVLVDPSNARVQSPAKYLIGARLVANAPFSVGLIIIQNRPLWQIERD